MRILIEIQGNKLLILSLIQRMVTHLNDEFNFLRYSSSVLVIIVSWGTTSSSWRGSSCNWCGWYNYRLRCLLRWNLLNLLNILLIINNYPPFESLCCLLFLSRSLILSLRCYLLDLLYLRSCLLLDVYCLFTTIFGCNDLLLLL